MIVGILIVGILIPTQQNMTKSIGFDWSEGGFIVLPLDWGKRKHSNVKLMFALQGGEHLFVGVGMDGEKRWYWALNHGTDGFGVVQLGLHHEIMSLAECNKGAIQKKRTNF